jgi:hypothetical protein
MKIIKFISHLVIKNDTYASLYSSALNEGIKDVFKEMGDKVEKGSANVKKENDNHNSTFHK